MRDYAIYIFLVAVGFGLWALLFWFQRRSSSRMHKMVGWVFIGPLHDYMERRGYRLSKRELVGWGLVAIVMVAAPLATWWLER